MSDTRPIREMTARGRARAHTLKDGRIRLSGTHIIALLHLIEHHGALDIRVTAGEWQALEQWPHRRMSWTIDADTPEHWARAAVELMQAGPPAGRRLPLMLTLLAASAFALTWGLLQLLFGG